MDAFDILLQGLKGIPGIDNGEDRLIYPFEGSFEDDQKRFLGIPNAERIVYVRVIFADVWILAITNQGIYSQFNNKLSGIPGILGVATSLLNYKFNIRFEDINEVKYSERKDAFIFSNGSQLGRHSLVKKMDNRYCFEFAEILTKAANSVLGVMDYYTKGISLVEEEKHDAALVEFNKALEIDTDDFMRAKLYYHKGLCLHRLDKKDEARLNLITAKEISSKSSDSDVQALIPTINVGLGAVVDSPIESHKLLVEAFDKTTDPEEKRDILECLNKLHESEDFNSVFVSHDRLSERKVIIVLRDNTTPLPGKSLLCLEQRVLKSLGTSFPMNHPVDGCVYLAHPIRNNYYIPAAEYDEVIFLEKINEYCYLLQCLGAKEIKIQKIAGKSLEEMNESKFNAGAAFVHKLFDIDGNVDYRSRHHSNSNDSYEYRSYMSFNPIRKPYVPNDLNWLAIEPKWKRLIDNRLSGSLTHFVEEISTSEDKLLSKAEEMSVNLEIKALITKFKGHVNTESTVTLSSKQATTWRIEVIF